MGCVLLVFDSVYISLHGIVIFYSKSGLNSGRHAHTETNEVFCKPDESEVAR